MVSLTSATSRCEAVTGRSPGAVAPVEGRAGRPTVLLGIDFEDWDQLMARRYANPGWDRPSRALERQTAVLLDLLDELRARATFFVLGMSGRHHPDLLTEVAARGHELASHGYDHRPIAVHTAATLADDLARGREVVESAGAPPPQGYRAPGFSLGREQTWALPVIRAAGFRYESSLYDSPLVRGRLRPAAASPYRHTLGEGGALWAVPLAVAPVGPTRVPVAGSTYWRVLPPPALRSLLRRQWASAPVCPLYFHPYDFDPRPVDIALTPGATGRQRRGARRQVQLHRLSPGRVTAALWGLSSAVSFRTYGEAVAAAEVGASDGGVSTVEDAEVGASTVGAAEGIAPDAVALRHRTARRP